MIIQYLFHPMYSLCVAKKEQVSYFIACQGVYILYASVICKVYSSKHFIME